MPHGNKARTIRGGSQATCLFLIVLLFPLLLWVGITSATEINVLTGSYYDWWDDTRDNRAWQFNIPLKIEVRHEDLSITVLTGYTNTSLNPSHGNSRSLSHLLDTKLNLSYEIVGKLPVDLLIGLDFNFPSGKTNLSASQVSLMMDPYLISINKFGEGFNINPTVTVAKEWGDWAGGIGIGYLWRGEYNFGYLQQDSNHDIHITNYDPGDVLNVNAEMRYYFSPNWDARFFVNYANFEKEEWDQEDTFIAPIFSESTVRNSLKEGDFYLFGLGLHYNQEKWDAAFTLRGILRAKCKFQDEDGSLDVAEHNLYGDEWIGDLSVSYSLNKTTTFRTLLQGLVISKNDYATDSPFFMGQRERISLGLGASRLLSQHLEAAMNLQGFIMHDDEVNFPTPLSSRDYHGLSLGLTLTGRF